MHHAHELHAAHPTQHRSSIPFPTLRLDVHSQSTEAARAVQQECDGAPMRRMRYTHWYLGRGFGSCCSWLQQELQSPIADFCVRFECRRLFQQEPVVHFVVLFTHCAMAVRVPLLASLLSLIVATCSAAPYIARPLKYDPSYVPIARSFLRNVLFHTLFITLHPGMTTKPLPTGPSSQQGSAVSVASLLPLTSRLTTPLTQLLSI